jgi:hypothetical protein
MTASGANQLFMGKQPHVKGMSGKSNLTGINEFKPFCSSTGRPSIDPELLVRMLLVGYCYGIRSEQRLCKEVHLNLAYR